MNDRRADEYPVTGEIVDKIELEDTHVLTTLRGLGEALGGAISKKQLHIDYQPIIRLETGKIVGLEALLRWDYPDLAHLSPRWFISVAEETGLIVDIGRWTIQRACEDLRHWIEQGFSGLRLMVNLSSRQLHHPLLIDHLSETLRMTSLDANLLCLEITESTLMHDLPACENVLRCLKSLGVKLALNDFGTGSLPLQHLDRFPFDIIKMGRSIVQDMIDNRTGDAMILRVLMAQARNRGVLLAAKKVETEEQCLMLSRNLIEEMQGSVFSKALVAEDITVLLRDNTCLSDRLSRAQKVDRTLLLVDDEVNILSALKRTLRRNNYRILTAESGSAALALLDEHKVDVIVSDQRMPEMTGVQFFTQAKQKFPDTVRIILSGYTELQSVTDAINEGAVYRFVTKPWDDTKLREHIAEAFQRKEMADENQHLNQELRRANLDLAEANRQLAILLEKQKEQIIHNEMSLHIVREALQQVPLPVIGLDEDDTIVFINVAATAMLEGMDIGLGHDICQIIPGFICTDADYGVARRLDVHGRQFVAWAHKMGQGSQSRGTLLVIAEHEESYHETHH